MAELVARLLPVPRVRPSNLNVVAKFEAPLVKWFGSAVVASLSEYRIVVFTHGNK